MKCIWCKSPSDQSRSQEHILPESLGNRAHVLPPGWVCDACNNYLARKVEKPFLNSSYGRACRFDAAIPNKKGRIPSASGMHMQSRVMVEVIRDTKDRSISVGPLDEKDDAAWSHALSTNNKGTLLLPTSKEPPQDRTLSRFIGKVGLEVLAVQNVPIAGWNDELVNQPALDELRQYVRYGHPHIVWPVSVRRLYPSEMLFVDGAQSFEVLHEWTILVTEQEEYYGVIAILGLEYTINLGGPELEGYEEWLQKHNSKSHLYWNQRTGETVIANSANFD